MTDEQAGAILPFDDGSAGRLIRRMWHDGRWFFSVVDAVAVLTDSRDPGAYWRKLKQRLTDEGAGEPVTNCHGLKLRAPDGKLRTTDAADTETLLRIVQSIPSPKAEPFKRWLAQEGARRLAEVAAEMSEDQRRLLNDGILRETTQRLEQEAWHAGILSPHDMAVFHDYGYRGLYGESASEIAQRKDVPAAEISEWMSSDEQSYNMFRASLTEQALRRDGIDEPLVAQSVHFETGRAVREFVASQGATLPEALPTPERSIQQLEAAEQKRLAREKAE